MSVKGIVISLSALVISVAMLVISFFETETLSITSSLISIVLFAVALYKAAVQDRNLNTWIILFVVVALVIAAIPSFFDVPKNIAVFLDTCPYVAVATLIVAEMVAFMEVRLDKLLFSAFILFIEMAIASFAAVVTYLIRIEDIRSEVIVNNDIVVQFGAGFLIGVAVVVSIFCILKNKKVRLVTNELILED